jgi:peptidoglycan/xylan/chitin deacetylase (PgdA/CDA1 family)
MRAILTYHSVDASGSAISIAEAEFRAHVQWLASGAVPVVSLEQLTGPGAPDDALAITFDDAFQNFADVAWPMLRAHGLPVTLFVVSGQAGGSNAWGGREAPGIPTLPLMDWDALGRAAEEGVTLGSHSRTHNDLRRQDAAGLAGELSGSAETIAERTDRRPTTFAYPYGAVDARVAAAAGASYRVACTTALRPVEARDTPLQLPRLDTYYLRDAARLATWGTPGFRRYLTLRAGFRRARAALTGGAA